MNTFTIVWILGWALTTVWGAWQCSVGDNQIFEPGAFVVMGIAVGWFSWPIMFILCALEQPAVMRDIHAKKERLNVEAARELIQMEKEYDKIDLAYAESRGRVFGPNYNSKSNFKISNS